MDNRKYNIYFHTHTISGIIICAVLYVIFFAGSFAFFKNDLAAWQKNHSHMALGNTVKPDFNEVLDSLSKTKNLLGRDIDFSLRNKEHIAYLSISGTKDSVLAKQVKAAKKPEGEKRGRRKGRGGDDDSAFLTYDFSKKQEADYAGSYTIGEFLYRLHFLAQLNQVLPFRIGVPFGYLLAGIVSFIFVFALITGLLLHWNKMVSNFFTFRPWNKWKTVWTDLHTALGVIGFPFQLVFAVTGVILIFNSFLVIPYTKIFYKGDSEKLLSDLEYTIKNDFDYTYKPLKHPESVDINKFVKGIEGRWKSSDITVVGIRNYGDENMHLVVQAKPLPDRQFAGLGQIAYRVSNDEIISEKQPLSSPTYVSVLKSIVYRLHFGDYGGRPVRVMYFVLGIIGCVVINSGVMIWLVARDKNNVPKKKRVFNFWTANVFIASSLSMLPVTAFVFIVLLFLKKPGQSDIYAWYFYSWLLLGLYFIIRRDLALTNKHSTALSAVLCMLIPVLDGIVRGNWFWATYKQGAFDILFVDILFLVLSLISGIILWKIIRKETLKKQSATEREISYAI